MITKEQVMPLLLGVCPSFTEKWEEYRSSDLYEEGWLYLDLAELAHHLVVLKREAQTGEFPAVFEVIERLHIEGDEYVKEAATIGLLEGIQNFAEGEKVNPEEFADHLMPETAKWWHKLNDFWSGNVNALRT